MRTESGKINCCSKVAKYHDDVSAWQLCGFCQKNPKHQFPTQSKYLLCFLKYIHFWQLNDSLPVQSHLENITLMGSDFPDTQMHLMYVPTQPWLGDA